MLALAIRYLNGFAAATLPESYEQPEWPPHPARVFMAMAAAHFQTGGEPLERDALLWLEGLDTAPYVYAPKGMPRAVVTHFVPVNDQAGPSKAILQSVPLTRERQARTFARVWLEHDTAWLIWPEVELDPAMHETLQMLCGKVTRVGHSTSLVQMWVGNGDEIAKPNWWPNNQHAQAHLRLPTKGTLAYLARCHNSDAVGELATIQLQAADSSNTQQQQKAKRALKAREREGNLPTRSRPQLSFYQGYAPRTKMDVAPSTLGSVFDPTFLSLQFERVDAPYRHLDLQCVLQVTEGWRKSLLSHSNDLSDATRTLLSGHTPDGARLEGVHLAFVPLAFVAHEHADGRLLGMGLALPRGVSREDKQGVLLAFSRVKRLKLGRLGVWQVEADTSNPPRHNLRPETWAADHNGATHWSTVTPIVYDRHPKSKDKAGYYQEVAAMISQACVRVGLPEPREAIVTPVSAHLGTPPAHVFPRLRRKDDSQRRHTHAILVFDEPVRGPILLGAGRYRGYGLLRPMSNRRNRSTR